MTLKDVESVKIDGVDYKLSFVDASQQLSVVDLAHFDFMNQEIKLIDCHEKVNVQSLVHELIHAIDGNRLGDVLTETQVEALSTGLCQIFFDSPDLVLAMYWAAVGDLIDFEPGDEDEEDGDETDAETEC